MSALVDAFSVLDGVQSVALAASLIGVAWAIAWGLAKIFHG
jgi:hypothetical protein